MSKLFITHNLNAFLLGNASLPFLLASCQLKSTMSLKTGLNHVDRCRPPSWSLHDYRNQWLEALNDMARIGLESCR